MEVIRERAFAFSRLEEISFQEGSRLREIMHTAFTGTNLKNFVAPPALRTLGYEAFSSCRSLKRVVLNEGMKVLGTEEGTQDVFHGSSLEHVRLPSTLERIEGRAFSNCASLSDVQLPEGLLYFRRDCFEGTAIRRIVLPLTLREIGRPKSFMRWQPTMYVRDGGLLANKKVHGVVVLPSAKTMVGSRLLGELRSIK